MRFLAFLAAMALVGCSPPPAYTPAPVHLTADGLPVEYETCMRRKARASVDFYGLFLDCRIEIVFYLAQLNASQEAKADMVDGLERKAMNRAQEVMERRN